MLFAAFASGAVLLLDSGMGDRTMNRFLAPLFVLVLVCCCFSSAFAQNGLPLDRYYSAREGTTWIFTQEIKISGDVTFSAVYQRGYQNKPISQLQFVRFTLTTPKETPIWDDLSPDSCSLTVGGASSWAAITLEPAKTTAKI